MNYKREGFALSIVLWIVAVLLIGIAFIASLSKESLHVSYMLKDKLATQIIAKNYLEAIKYYVMVSDNNGDRFICKNPILSLPKELLLNGHIYNLGEVTISLQDLSGLIRPNMIPTIIDKNIHRELSFIVRDSIQDWLDKDDDTRLNGAESSYYNIKENFSYRPANIKMFQSLDELKLVRGIKDIDSKTWQYIEDRVTYKDGSINLMLIDARYLSFLLHITLAEAKELLKIRELNHNKFMYLVGNNKYFDDSYMDFGISKIINIYITVTKKEVQTKLYVTLYIEELDKTKLFYIDGYRIY